MLRSPVIALLIVLIAFPAFASDIASREEAALALIPFQWQQLHYAIVFMDPRPGFRAMTFPAEHRIEVYARPKDDVHLLAYDIAHELGHAIDMTYNTAETRKKWLQLRGIDPSTPWFGCDRCTDFATPAGDFAETFAFILFGPQQFRGRIAPAPASKQIPERLPFFGKIFA